MRRESLPMTDGWVNHGPFDPGIDGFGCGWSKDLNLNGRVDSGEPNPSVRYIKSSSTPGDYSSSNRCVAAFLANRQKTCGGRAALNADADFEKVPSLVVLGC